MHICWRVVAAASFALSMISGALGADEAARNEPDVDMFASMAGKCSILKVAESDYACAAVAFFHSPGGRSSFAVALNDPEDSSHIITFSGENSKREQNDLYELAVDRMLIKSKDRPKVEGLPLPAVVLSSGTCRQIGNFAAQRVSSVSCAATDATGTKYELQFESDGSPIKVKMIRVADPAVEDAHAKVIAAHIEQLKCRQLAAAQGVLPRDRTAFILRCMED
jgi:hypothetical protein